MSTSITIQQTTQAQKSVTRSVSDINPNASNGAIQNFATALTGLTTNTIGKINRIDKTEIDGDYYDLTVTLDNDFAQHASFDNDTVSFDASKADDTKTLDEQPYALIIIKANNTQLPLEYLSFTFTDYELDQKPFLLSGKSSASGNGILIWCIGKVAGEYEFTINAGEYNELRWNAKTIRVVSTL